MRVVGTQQILYITGILIPQNHRIMSNNYYEVKIEYVFLVYVQ